MKSQFIELCILAIHTYKELYEVATYYTVLAGNIGGQPI